MASKSSRVWWARGRPVGPAGALRRRHGEGGRRVRRRAAHTETLLQGRARAGYQGPYLLVALLLERGGPEWVHIRSPSAGSWIRPRNTPALSALEAVGII